MARHISILWPAVRAVFAWKKKGRKGVWGTKEADKRLSGGFIFFEALGCTVILSFFFLALLGFSMSTMMQVQQLYDKDRGLQIAVSRMEDIRAQYMENGTTPGTVDEEIDGFILSIVQHQEQVGSHSLTRIIMRCRHGNLEICKFDTVLLPREWRERMYWKEQKAVDIKEETRGNEREI